MKVAIVFEHLADDHPLRAKNMEEVDVVSNALQKLGHEYAHFTLKTGSEVFSQADELLFLLFQFKTFAPTAIFNLIKSQDSGSAFSSTFHSFYDVAGFIYTGSSYGSIMIASSVELSRSLMLVNNIKTPPWAIYSGGDLGPCPGFPCVVRPLVRQGVNNENLKWYSSNELELRTTLPGLYRRQAGGRLLIEKDIIGRRVLIYMLEHKGMYVEPLPPVELKEGLRQVNTRGLPIDKLEEVALKCWEIFNLKGYASVELCIEPSGTLYVLQVNPTPSVSADSGLLLAARTNGYSDDDLVRIILEAAI